MAALPMRAATAEGAISLATDGETEAALVVADEPLVALKGVGLDADYTQRSVAEALQSWLEKASGIKMPILSASEVGDQAPLILVGRSAWTERYGLETPSESEGVRIRTFPQGVALLGEISEIPATGTDAEYDRGLFHAMRFFLERYLGYRFYFHYAVNGNEDFGIVIPDGERLAIPADIDFATAPAFSYRRTTRAGFESWAHPGNPEQRRPVWHPDSAWKSYYKNEHPEYFLQKKDGTRDYRYLDYSEPAVVDQRIEILERKESEEDYNAPGADPNAIFIPVAPADNLATNHDPRAKELTRPERNPERNFDHQPGNWGRQSHLYWSHIKAFAEKVKKRWPERRIETLAYQGFTLPPDFELPDNIDVILCVLTPSHLYKEPEAEAQVMELVKAWHEKLGGDRDRLRIWDYPCFPGFFTAAPLLYPHEKQRWLQDLRPYIAGEYWNSRGRSAQESHWFLNLADRMLWDPDLDVDAHLADYTEKFYGPAAEPMEKFFRLAIRRFEDVEWPGEDTAYDAGIYRGLYGKTYTPEVIEELETYFNEALVAVSVPATGQARDVKPGDRWLQGNPADDVRRYRIEIEGSDTPVVNPVIAWEGGGLRYRGELHKGLRLVVEPGDSGPVARLYPVELTDGALSGDAPAGGSEGRRQVVEWLRCYAHPGGEYRVSVTGRTENGGNSWAVLYYGRSGSGSFGDQFFGGTDVFGGAWSEVTDTFTVPEDVTAFNRLDLFRRGGTVYYGGMSLMPDLPEEGIDVSDRIEGGLPAIAANGRLEFRLTDDTADDGATVRLTLDPIGVDAERAAIHRERVLWMREWLEDFIPETSAYGGDRMAKMGFFVEARQAHEWLDRVPEYTVARVGNPPAADFSDPVWKAAGSTALRYGLDGMNGRNSTPFNRLGFAPDVPTRIQAVHDGKDLFVAFRAYQTHPPTPEDRVGFAFFDEDRELAKFELHADGHLEGPARIRHDLAVGPGWWGGFLAIPANLVGALEDTPASVRANFTRFRTAAPEEAAGPGESGAIELPMPAGATEPPALGGGARYTWSPLIDGGLGWGSFPWQERGVLVFE